MTPITESFAKSQVRRFAGMPSSQPIDEAVVRERIRALVKHARTEQHAQRLVDSLLDTCQFFPTVLEIKNAAEYITGETLPAGCDECGGEPWIVIERNGHEGTARCDCERGRFLKSRDKERTAA